MVLSGPASRQESMQLLEKELMHGARDVDGDVSDYTDIDSDDFMYTCACT